MKLVKYSNKEPVYYYNTNKQVTIPNTYKEKPFRAMWVSNVANIDLPTLDDPTYKQQVLTMLDTCQRYNLNAIFFQVRTTNDAFYASKLNPYSRFFTGEEGKKPPFDVFAWIIKEAHKRHIEVHAWCNPFRISFDGKLSIEDYLATCDDLNFAKQHPDTIMLDKKGKLILNPGDKDVRDFIVESMRELTTNYDIDGIHFDDYFYPYSGLDDRYDDHNEFSAQEKTLGDFRRDNINQTMQGVYKAIKKEKPQIAFGISPFGIWKNQTKENYGSHTDPKCSESYYNQYADTLAWIKGDYVDYIVPQIYWEFGHHIAPFADICDFWCDVCKATSTKLYIGHGAYRLGNEGEFSNPLEIVDQVKYANQKDEVSGNVFFTYKTFIDKDKAYDGMQALKKLLLKSNT
ncbi:MAG: family 10 glycosylhydrolase [Candidatus Izimaplasma sp.]|nr:family 10 glycosylhydrolase [Candidatus Izimaplasma bacterium]